MAVYILDPDTGQEVDVSDDSTTSVDDGTSYTDGSEVFQSVYQDVMHAPLLFENAVDDDRTQGVACLYDYTQSVTTWNYNQAPTNQTLYPINGEFVRQIKRGMVIIADVDNELTHQKFRITDVTYSDTGVTINSTHILAEFLANNPLTIDKIQLASGSAGDMLEQIFSNLAYQVPDLNYDSDVSTPKQVDADVSNVNALNAILDPDQQGDKPTPSVLANFSGEFVFDNFTLYHRRHAGRDTGITLKYGENMKSDSQEHSIQNTYVGIMPIVKYTPAQPRADMKNVNWSTFAGDWTSIGSVSYWGGNGVEIYDAPVDGHNVIGTLKIGQQIKLGKAVTNGQLIPNPANPNGTLEIDTVNGHTWYPIYSESDGGVGGWIDGTFVNFDKSGDYIVNDAVGHVTVDVKGTDTKNTRYPVSGTATVAYDGIHVYYSPDPGKDHYRRSGKGMQKKKGTRVHYDWIDVDENGQKWYRIGSHQWLYGPHLKIDSDKDLTAWPSHGTGLVKKGADVYHINTKTGKVTQEKKKVALGSARKKHKKSKKTVLRGHGKSRRKITIKKSVSRTKSKKQTKKKKVKYTPVKQKHQYRNLNYGQVVVGGTLYYKLSNGTYVKSSQIDWKAAKSTKPTSPDDLLNKIADKKGEVNLYNAPSKAGGNKKDGHAENIVIHDGESFRVDHTATSTGGDTWYEITITRNGKEITGWIPADVTNTDAVGDIEPHAPDDDDDETTGAGTDASNNTSTMEVTVTLDDSYDNVVNGVYYPPDINEPENAHILKVDLSSYFKHDDTDLSGQQADGSFKATRADMDQLYALTPDAAKQYNIGYFPVTTTATPQDFANVDADIASVHMYDTCRIDFVKFGKVETAPITSTVWEMKGDDSCYQNVVLGERPQTYYHLLSQKIDEKNNELRKSTAESFKHTGHLFQDMRNALSKEGSDRAAAEKDIAKQVGLVDEKTGKLEITQKQLDDRIVSINQDVTNIRNDILSGGTAELQFVDSSGNTNFLHPTEIRAVNEDGSYLVFNSHGLGFFDSAQGAIRSAITYDGQIAAERISSGTVSTLNVETGTIHGALIVGENTGMQINVGTDKPAASPLSPTYGGNVIWIDSTNYHGMISSGRAVFQEGDGNGDRWEYGTNGIRHNGNSFTYVVKDALGFSTSESAETQVKHWIQRYVKKASLK